MTHHSPTAFYIFLEYVIIFALVGEVAMRALAQREQYLKYKANIFDVVVSVVSVVMLAVLHRDCSAGDELEQ